MMLYEDKCIKNCNYKPISSLVIMVGETRENSQTSSPCNETLSIKGFNFLYLYRHKFLNLQFKFCPPPLGAPRVGCIKLFLNTPLWMTDDKN